MFESALSPPLILYLTYSTGRGLCFASTYYCTVLVTCGEEAFPLTTGHRAGQWRATLLPDGEGGDTSQSLFGLLIWGMIKAFPTQELRENVTAARESTLFFSFSVSVPGSPDCSILCTTDVVCV